MKITSGIIKTALLHLYRFKKGFLAATEFRYELGIADVITLSKDNEIIEIEVKISKSDLLAEMKHKETKHARISEHSLIKWTPNRYFLCVPTPLVKDAIEFCETVNPKYGVIEFDDSKGLVRHPEDLLSVARKSQKLHSEDRSVWFREFVTKRMNNDLVKMYTDKYWS
jgi:hypothetical protein